MSMCCMIHFASGIDLHFREFTVIFLFVIILTEILGTSSFTQLGSLFLIGNSPVQKNIVSFNSSDASFLKKCTLTIFLTQIHNCQKCLKRVSFYFPRLLKIIYFITINFLSQPAGHLFV